ncbi:uncharacterized protein PFL1_04063 [Pseudozyma flocculosa PF-1]|uniref:Uncharacterized protein n=1 Tax=Pseudozyma flocculosa PF-1 TaxID=1277687 RepID=A0A061HC90_9BASI|nr:uncharacterized protein PFL1_04063 [Pseudozyma flocculosa PF-1]EPQ28236.1 hypothetical protein PFL1_04063 [Pseudozyma flocculosa PF-1]
MDKSTGPVTPTKALLRRIHRRSSVLPPGEAPPPPLPSAFTAPATAAAAASSSKTGRRISSQLQRDPPVIEAEAEHRGKGDADKTEHDKDGEDEDEDEAVWKEVGQLLDTVQMQNERILDLDKRNRELERELANERDKAKAARERSDKGLTRLSAIKVEREFLSQEMILKGLQRDNEDKTLEVENLRRRLKIMSDFLAHTYGDDDWQGVVAAGVGVSSLPAVPHGGLPSRSPEKDVKDPFGGASAIARVFDNASASPLAKSRPPAFAARLGSQALQQQGGNPFAPPDPSSSRTPLKHKHAGSGSGSGSGAGARPPAATNNDDVVIPTVARMHSPLASPAKAGFDVSLGPADFFDAAEEAAAEEAEAAAATAGGLDPAASNAGRPGAHRATAAAAAAAGGGGADRRTRFRPGRGASFD